MPSWNVHIAHVEHVLKTHTLEGIGVHNPSAFLLGNLLPDLYVGYMVPDITKKILYNTTHMAPHAHVPLPNYQAFGEEFLSHTRVSYDQETSQDLVLGAWCHLMCDHTYNQATRTFLDAHHIEHGEQARIGKQTDLDTYGRTLDITRTITIDDDLIAQVSRFAQYEIDMRDVCACARVVKDIVARNKREHIDGIPQYMMLHQAFFDDTFKSVNDLLDFQLTTYAHQHLA